MKKEIPLDSANRLINNGPVVLVSCQQADQPNVFTVAWNMPVSHEPPLVAISCGASNYSHEVIMETEEFVLNVPDARIVEPTFRCGTISGAETDKFEATGLTPAPAKEVESPIVEECVGHLECKLIEKPDAGDHSIFVGEVLAAYAEADKFDEVWQVEQTGILHHLGGNNFCESRNLHQV